MESIPPAYVAWVGRYNNPIPTRFLASIDCLKIPALYEYIFPKKQCARYGRKTIHVVHELYIYTVKKGLPFSRPQPGCT
jgi:hypothetical protein